jgi:hypothetical protein
MNYYDLLKRAVPSSEPLYTGYWGTLLLRPDLGCQQEFIVGVAASVAADNSPHIRWLPSFSALSRLYGDDTTANEISDLTTGAEQSINSSFKNDLSKLDCGTPHIRFSPCGYFAADDIGFELTQLLKRHAGPIWAEPSSRDIQMDDSWAYSIMRDALSSLQTKKDIFTPGQTVMIEGRSLRVGLNTGHSFGNIVSACYTNFQTIERHIYSSIAQVSMAHRLAQLSSLPAVFAVLPSLGDTAQASKARKSAKFLASIEDMGIVQFCDSDPQALAEQIKAWANI